MSNVTFSNLSTHDELREFLYHIKGLIEADEKLASLMEALNGSYDTDLEKTAETLSLIEVEIVDHIGYHRKTLKNLLAKLLRNTYRTLERVDQKRNPDLEPPRYSIPRTGQ